ncbi:MAG: DUF4062 domain-containing protein [Chloroflexi bacterium]|nr:DUF4062 domain-containing protein [Chloroflexota bacterium]
MKKTVFISSTYEDLDAHRQAVWGVLKEFDVNVRGMEEFGARTECALETCLAEVDQSDVYLGIIAFRVGSIDSVSGKSFTQLEYEHAVKHGKEILIYLADEQQATVRYSSIDLDHTLLEKLKAFKATLRQSHTVNTFTDPNDLVEKLRRDFSRHFEAPSAEPSKQPDEFDITLNLVQDFLIMPKKVIGREARFCISFFDEPYPASRSLCEAFKMEYGMTVGSHITIEQPQFSRKRLPFQELYATGVRAEIFLELARTNRKSIELYARLQFSEQDVRRIQGEFFGHSYSVDEIFGDPFIKYVPAEGKSILLFTKVAS